MNYSYKKGRSKNLLMIFIAILIIGCAFWIAEYRNKDAKLIYTNTEISTSTSLQNLADSTDWKKILLANEPNSSSTVKDLTKAQEKLTDTDIMARDFFSRYMELRQIGEAGNEYSQQELISNVLRNGAILASPKTYSNTDILIKDDNSIISIKQYGNEIGNIFKTYAIPSRNEAVIVKDSMEKENPEILKELDPIIKSYKNMLNGLLKVKTPQSMAQIHMDLINIMSSMVFMVENFRKSNIDPLAGIQATSLVLKNMEDLNGIFQKIKDNLTLSGISYTSSEGGFIFMSK